jgi:hypothetical protein
MGRLARLTCTVALLLLAVAPAASASTKKPHFYRLGVGDGPAVTDGQRDVAFQANAQSVAFYDFGVKVPSGRLVSRPQCPHTFDQDTLGYLAAVGDGKIAWSCSTAYGEPPAITDVATGSVTVFPDTADHLFSSGEGTRPVGIGRRWLEFFTKDHSDPPRRWFYDLVSGVKRSEQRTIRQVPNLDKPTLAQTMCAPLKQTVPVSFYREGRPYRPYFYERPYGVGLLDPAPVTTKPVARLTLQRCGSRKVSVIARCKDSCDDVGFSGGVVTWTQGNIEHDVASVLHAYVPRTGKHYEWPVLGFTPGASPRDTLYGTPSIIHTRQRLIASIGPRDLDGQWQIWAARLPSTHR